LVEVLGDEVGDGEVGVVGFEGLFDVGPGLSGSEMDEHDLHAVTVELALGLVEILDDFGVDGLVRSDDVEDGEPVGETVEEFLEFGESDGDGFQGVEEGNFEIFIGWSGFCDGRLRFWRRCPAGGDEQDR